jgi:hypothetical protein
MTSFEVASDMTAIMAGKDTDTSSGQRLGMKKQMKLDTRNPEFATRSSNLPGTAETLR